MLYLSEEDVRELLPMREAIGLMRDAFEALAQGRAINQLRRRLILDTGAVLNSMAGSYKQYFGTKFYSTHPKYGANFYFVLYDAATAQPLAWMEANHLGQIRTGAASGYATDLLANPEADTLGVIGSGFQARSQIEAIRAYCCWGARRRDPTLWTGRTHWRANACKHCSAPSSRCEAHLPGSGRQYLTAGRHATPGAQSTGASRSSPCKPPFPP